MSGKSSHDALRALMMSVSVELSLSCTVHVSGTGPFTSLQSVSSLAVGGILANDTSTTTHHTNELRNASEVTDILPVFVVIYAQCTTSLYEKKISGFMSVADSGDGRPPFCLRMWHEMLKMCAKVEEKLAGSQL